MAKTESSKPVNKIGYMGPLGKSTLIGNLNVSIPMPPGATPPPAPAAPSQGAAGSAIQGAKKNG
jgi:hypothetical protein